MKLREFLVKAKKATYANEKVKEIKIKGGGKVLTFSKGKFRYQDKYFGTNPFYGEEIVLLNRKVIWIMNYCGQAKNKEVYTFLKKSLKRVEKNKPFRGPTKFKEGKFEYTNKVLGNMEGFIGEEKITKNKKQIYGGHYHGGFVK